MIRHWRVVLPQGWVSWRGRKHPLAVRTVAVLGQGEQPSVWRFLGLAAALLSILASSSISAGASLSVREDARHADVWFRSYDELPTIWKTRRIVKLREVTARDMERLIAQLDGEEADRHDDSVVDGCYQSGEGDEDTPIITLCDTLRGEQATLVFTHEYGHFVWDAMLTSRERARYTRLWRSQKRTHHLVTEYAGDSEEEGFAEAFAYFLRKPALLQRRDPVSMQFCREVTADHTSETAP